MLSMANKNQFGVRRNFLKYLGASLIVACGAVAWFVSETPFHKSSSGGPTGTPLKKYMLPIPKFSSKVMLEEAIAWRRSLREYKEEPITIENLSMLLWAAQGVNEFNYGLRTVPSAGGTYPIDVYVSVCDNGVLMEGMEYLPSGSYKYNCKDHSLRLIKTGNVRDALATASLKQDWVSNAVISIVVFATFERTTKVYGERGQRYVHMEDGHVGQNIYLMATALNLGAVVIGAFDDNKVKESLGAEPTEQPLYVIPVSVPKEPYRITEQELSDYYQKVRQSE